LQLAVDHPEVVDRMLIDISGMPKVLLVERHLRGEEPVVEAPLSPGCADERLRSSSAVLNLPRLRRG